MQKDPIVEELRRALVDLLTGPTCLNNAERIVDNLLAANDIRQIRNQLDALSYKARLACVTFDD